MTGGPSIVRTRCIVCDGQMVVRDETPHHRGESYAHRRCILDACQHNAKPETLTGLEMASGGAAP